MPVKPAGNHQMQDEPMLFFESYADAFTQATQRDNLSSLRAGDWGHCGAQQKRPRNLHALERLTQNALLQRFDVNDDVRQFRQSDVRLAGWI